jgi:hypothetical protein
MPAEGLTNHPDHNTTPARNAVAHGTTAAHKDDDSYSDN